MKFQFQNKKIFNFALGIGVGLSAGYLAGALIGSANNRLRLGIGLMSAWSAIIIVDKYKSKKSTDKHSDELPGSERLNLDLASTEPAICVKHYTDKIKTEDWEPNADIYLKRGASYQNLGQHENAIQDFEQALEIDPLNFVAIA